MAANTIALITGSNRGIGLGLARLYLSRPNHTVIAAVRDPFNVPDLEALKAGANSRLLLVQIDGKDNSHPEKAVSRLRSEHNIEHIDFVIANAGIAVFSTLDNLKPTQLADMFQVNVIAVLSLFQATKPLLEKAADPKFAAVGSLGGSFFWSPDAFLIPNSGYGASKAAEHFLVRKLAHEGVLILRAEGREDTTKKVTTFTVHPGIVGTDMGADAAKAFDTSVFGIAAISIDESAEGIASTIDNATFESANAKLLNYGDGKVLEF